MKNVDIKTPQEAEDAIRAAISELGPTRNALGSKFPSRATAISFLHTTFGALFPQLIEDQGASIDRLVRESASELSMLLHSVGIKSSVPLQKFLQSLPKIQSALLGDAKAILAGDPAAKSIDEIILAYPGFFAIATFRISHELHVNQVPTVPRMISEYAHQKTGIDIHPGATIGRDFVIDHGTGIVIGETSVIHNNVKLYQGVTLGALSVEKQLADTKRHPTIEDDVVIYANATILGGKTVVGAGSVIGGNVWLTNSVPPGTTVYHKEDLTVKGTSA